jgi:hypothetical protein
MMKVRVEVAFDVLEGGQVPDRDRLAAHLGDVLNALMDIETVLDPDVSATLSEGHVEISLILEVEDELTAAEEGVAAVRAAVNAAGGYQSWGVVDENMHVSIDKLDELSPA